MIGGQAGVAALALLFSGLVSAQDSAAVVVPVRVVDGHLVVIGYLSNRAGDVNDVSLEVSFEDPGVLTLHSNGRDEQYEWLGNPPVVKLTLKPDVALELPGTEVRPERRRERMEMQNRITRLSSNKLDEHRLKGVLGIGFLRKYRVTMDVAAGTLVLSSLEDGMSAAGQVVSPFILRNGRITFPMDYAAGRSGEMSLGGDAYDTYISAVTATGLGRPAGDVMPLWLTRTEGIDLSAQMALRPGDTRGVTVITGVNFLEAFRVEVDWAGSMVAFTPTARPPYQQADFAYFQTGISGTPEAFEAYLEKYPAARLSPEAAQRLMVARTAADVNSSDQELMRALKWVAETSPAERKMENCAEAVRAFRVMPGRDALVAEAGAFALKFSRTAVTVQDTYRLHNIVGEAYLNLGKVEEGWKHLLSAAFMPLDDRSDRFHNIEVNLNLARAYDRMGRATRAYSRYFRTWEAIGPMEEQIAATPEDIPNQPPAVQREIRVLRVAIPEVKAALERLRRQIPAGQLRMLEG